MMETLESRQSSFRDLLDVIFKRKNQILLFFVITVCAVVTGTFVVKPTYEAKAQILVKIGRQNLYNPPNTTNSILLNYNRENQINSEIELLKNRSLAEQVVNLLGPMTIYKDINDYKGVITRFFQRTMADTTLEKAILKFQKSLSIKGVKKSDVIEISFKHKDPKMAATIVNTLANAYLDKHLLVHKNSQSYRFFEDQSQTLKGNLKQTEEGLEAFKKKYNVTVLGEQQRLLLKQIADLRADLNRTLSNEVETGNRILQIRKQLNETPITIPQGEEVDHNSILISNLESRLVELQVEEKELLRKYTPQNRLVQNVKEKIVIVQNKLSEQETKRYEKSRIGLNTTYQRLKENLFQNRAEQKALAAKKEMQNSQLKECQAKLGRLNEMEVKIGRLQQAVDINRENYRLYLAKFEESRISDAMDNKKINNVILMDRVLPPLKPVSPKILLNILLSVFIGGLGGLGLAFLGDYLDDSMEKPEDVEKTLHLPVLASISEVAEGERLYGWGDEAVASDWKIKI